MITNWSISDLAIAANETQVSTNSINSTICNLCCLGSTGKIKQSVFDSRRTAVQYKGLCSFAGGGGALTSHALNESRLGARHRKAF